MVDRLMRLLRHSARLSSVHGSELVHGETEDAFDRLTRLASRFLRCPIVVVELVEDDRMYFRSQVGLPESRAPEGAAAGGDPLCRQVVRTREPLVVEDVRHHEESADVRAVREVGGVAVLAIPLKTPGGLVLGGFCVIDREPRRWTGEEVEVIEDLAHSATTEVELRLMVREAGEGARVQAALEEVMHRLGAAMRLSEVVGAVVEAAVAHTHAFGAYLERAEGAGPDHEVEVIAASGDRVPELGTRARYPGSRVEETTGSDEPGAMAEVRPIGAAMRPHLDRSCRGCPGLVVPLESEGEALGTLVLLRSPEQEPFGTGEVAFARALADAAAAALRRVLLMEELRESEERFRELAENVREVFWIADPGFTRFLYVSPAYHDIWGRTVESLYADASSFLDAVHPEDRPRVLEIMEALMRGEEVGVEYRIVRRGGEVRWLWVRGFPVQDAHGALYHIVGVSEDVTDRKEREERTRLLAEAGQVLSASLEYEKTLRSAARLAVQSVADWCVADVLEEGVVRRVGIAHADPGREEFAREYLRRYPPDIRAEGAIARVLRTGEPELLPQIPEVRLSEIAHDEAHLRTLRDLGMRSAMIVPMITRGRTLGTITLIAAESGRTYGPDDLAFAEELAGRAAIAVDNARLYEEAQGARRRVTRILESITDAFFAVDRDWRFTYVNRQAEEALQRSRDELRGRSVWEAFPEAEGSIFQREYERALAEQTTAAFEAYYPPLGLWVDVRAYPSPEGLSVFFRDVTDQKRADEERRRLFEREREAREEAERHAREEAALRRATEAVSASFTVEEVIRQIARSALEATEANGAFVKQLDMTRGEVAVVAVAGENTPSPGSRSPYAGSFTERVVEHEQPEVVDDISEAERLIAADLAEICPHCSAVVVPLLDAGAPIGSLVLLRAAERRGFEPDEIDRARTFAHLASLAFRKVHLLEESERRREELERITESRARLMRGFSHDVKNPLGAADGYAGLLEDGIVGDLSEKQRESVVRIRRSIHTALRLIEDLLELARAEAGQIEIRHVATDVREAVREMSEEYRAQAEAKGLTMEVDLPDEFPIIDSDADRVRQILGNLVSNAVKYTPEGTVTVRVEIREAGAAPGSGRWVAVDVADTGRGIPGEKRHLLFEEFARLDPGAERGAGLGLAMSRRIAHALSGDITVETESGKGSTFTLWLPLNRIAERQGEESG